MKHIIIAIAFTLAAFSSIAADPQKAATVRDQDPVVGRWRPGNSKVPLFLHTDGTASDPGRRGTWVCLTPGATPRKYRITWNNGQWVDTLHLVNGGAELVGENQDHSKLRWTRLPL